jgi:hypothetical protein
LRRGLVEHRVVTLTVDGLNPAPATKKSIGSPGVVLRMAVEPRGRLLSESLALAEAPAKEMGFEPVMDQEFADDLEEMIRHRKPRDTSAWD